MPEILGKINCPDCGDEAEARKGKQSYDINCHQCGRFPYQSKAGQSRLVAKFQKAGLIAGIPSMKPSIDPGMEPKKPEVEKPPAAAGEKAAKKPGPWSMGYWSKK